MKQITPGELQAWLADRGRDQPVLLGHELLARHQVEQVEHFLIQHLPGADLLLDHVGARLFQIHRRGTILTHCFLCYLCRLAGVLLRAERVRESL